MSARAPTWTELSQLGVAVLSAFGAFLLPTPSFLESSTRAWPAQFIVVVVTGLLVVAAQSRRGLEHTRFWVGVAVGALSLALVALVAERWLLDAWTCRYYGSVRVIGTELSTSAAEYLSEHAQSSCEELLKAFTGRSEEIWTRASLARSELVLALSHLCVAPLLAACGIATLQAVSCSRQAQRELRAGS